VIWISNIFLAIKSYDVWLIQFDCNLSFKISSWSCYLQTLLNLFLLSMILWLQSMSLQTIKNMRLSKRKSKSIRKKFFEKRFWDVIKRETTNFKNLNEEKLSIDHANVHLKQLLFFNSKNEISRSRMSLIIIFSTNERFIVN
jgi:hypothetical protein